MTDIQVKDINENFPVLIVDDETSALMSMSIILRTEGIRNVILCENALKATSMAVDSNAAVVLLDLTMPNKSGTEILDEITEQLPDAIVVIVSGRNDIGTAVKCIKAGAFDFIEKPVERQVLIAAVKRALSVCELKRENAEMKQRLLNTGKSVHPAFSKIITNSPAMRNIFSYCEAVSTSREPVLVTGETGTGKELFAQSIHTLSGRKGKFVAVNLAGIDSSIFSDTLFGHVKGAFTGADKDRAGLVEEASGGTLFLDEIGDLNRDSQIKLLRLLQEHEFTPVGSDKTKISDVRIVVATHRDLLSLSESGEFRSDLYFRLRTHQIDIPPLRERLSDIELLVEHFLKTAADTLGKKKPAYPPSLVTLLKTYHFPGNVRELRAMIFDAVSNHKSMMLSMQSFESRIHLKGSKEHTEVKHSEKICFPLVLPSLKEAVNAAVNEAMLRADGNQSVAAKMLGISQQALSKRLKLRRQTSI